MAYVLDIRMPETGGDGEAVASGLQAGLVDHGTIEPTDTGFVFVTGGTRLTVVRTRDESGKVDGVDVEIPYGALEVEVGPALAWILEAAADHGDRVFDPQLGRGVHAGEGAAVLASFVSASSYHVDYAGQVEDSRAGVPDPGGVTPVGSKTQLKVILAIVAVLVGAWIVFQSCVVGPMTRALSPPADEDALDGGPPPGWVSTHPTTLSPGSVKVREAGDGGR